MVFQSSCKPALQLTFPEWRVLVKPPCLNPLFGWGQDPTCLSGGGGPEGLPLFQECDPIAPKSCSLHAKNILPLSQIFPVSSWQSCCFLCRYQRGIIGQECPCCSCWCSVSTQTLCGFLEKSLCYIAFGEGNLGSFGAWRGLGDVYWE